MSRETSWLVESFGDLHLSGSEPRIFPGLVSSRQRGDSLARERNSNIGEVDDHGSGSTSRRGGKMISNRTGLDGAVAEESTEESDTDMEEAGGLDEQN